MFSKLEHDVMRPALKTSLIFVQWLNHTIVNNRVTDYNRRFHKYILFNQ